MRELPLTPTSDVTSASSPAPAWTPTMTPPSGPTPTSAGSPTTAFVPPPPGMVGPDVTSAPPAYGPAVPVPEAYLTAAPPELSHHRHLSGRGVAVLVLVSLVAVLVLVSLVAYSLGHVARPQATPPLAGVATPVATSAAATAGATFTPEGSGTPTKGFTYDGSSITGPGFSARLPDGWWVASGNGAYNDGEAVSSVGRFYYFAGGTDPAPVVCPRVVDSMKGKPSDTPTTLDPTPWGTVDAVTVDLRSTSKDTGTPVAYTVYCVDIPAGGSASLVAVSNYANQQRTRDAARALLASWVWT